MVRFDLQHFKGLVQYFSVRVLLLQGREGEIRHLFRGFAFLHCKKLVENGGMFVCKTRHLVLAGGSKVSASLAASDVTGVSHWPEGFH